MSYGDDGGAIGYLVGKENMGLAYMFTMMNNARLNVGMQGVGIAERSLQLLLRKGRKVHLILSKGTFEVYKLSLIHI